jgi:hypothetical protein
MPRNMSFSITTPQFQARSKTVTRRLGWWFLQPGDVVKAVEKARGLKKGEKVKPLGLMRIVSARSEPLYAITDDDVVREGNTEWTREQYIEKFIRQNKISADTLVNRIEFEHIDSTG